MKKIRIKIHGLGYNNKHQAYIKICDINNCLVYDGKTYNGEIIVLLDLCTLYKIYIKTCGEELNINFYTNQDEFEFYITRSIISLERTITFLLTDYYYDNLKIERGDLILWQKT